MAASGRALFSSTGKNNAKIGAKLATRDSRNKLQIFSERSSFKSSSHSIRFFLFFFFVVVAGGSALGLLHQRRIDKRR